MTPKVSIVMPTYNRAESFLKDAIESILQQSYADFELIIVDDGSIDATANLVLSMNDKRISYHKTDHNHGEYWSTNYGVNLALGKYVGWVHSDDLISQDSINLRVAKLESDGSLDFVHGDIARIDEMGKVTEKIKASDLPKEEILSQYLLPEDKRQTKYLIHHTTILMKWSFFYKAGPFDCSLPFAGDIDWLIRAIRAGRFASIHEILYYYRSHPMTRRVLDIKSGIDKEQVNRMIIRRYAKT